MPRSKPSRILIRELDDLTGSYPTTRRTGDQERPGTHLFPFHASRVLVSASYTSLVYPQRLPQSMLNRYNSSSPKSTIVAPGAVTLGVSDSGLSLPHRRISNESMGPFIDNKYFIDNSKFFLTGSPPSVSNIYIGLGERLVDKIAININVDSLADKIVTRYDSSYTARASSEFSGQDLTGFCYYNFKLKKWEDVGLDDKATNAATNYKFTYYLKGDNIDLSQHDYRFKPSQFSMSPHIGYAAKDLKSLKKTFGYDKIGYPTDSGAAPYSSMYYATSSQLYTLKDGSINDPFLLEKAVLRIPVNVRRKQGGYMSSTQTSLKVDGANRDIDNYTFFLYRQRKQSDTTKDSQTDAATSKRFLITSGCASFYNSRTLSTTAVSEISAGGLLPHSPCFSYDFDMPVSGATANARTIEYEGVLTIKFTVAVPSQQFAGATRWPTYSSVNDIASNTSPGGQTLLQNYWTGGTTAASQSYSLNKIVKNSNGNQRMTYFSGFSPFSIPDISRNIDNDPRPMISSFGYSTSKFSSPPNSPYAFSTQVSSNIISPYLLFPDDEIVIGIDAGISSTEARAQQVSMADSRAGMVRDDSVSIMTGSRMIIRSGGATLTLYGSIVRNSVRLPFSLNQPLTSDSIHEAVGSEPITDQYMIFTKGELYKSHIDNLVEGSIFSKANPRRVVGSLGSVSNASGSLLRGMTAFDYSERYYDSIPPDLIDFARRSGFDVSSDRKSNMPIIKGTALQFVNGSNKRNAFPYDTRTERKIQNSAILKIIGSSVLAVRKQNTNNLNNIDEIMFKEGWVVNDAGGNRRSYNNTGATSLRYGMINYKAQYTKSIFRSDHFGQHSDMLEQRKYSKFFIETVFPRDKSLREKYGQSLSVSVNDAAITALFFTKDGLPAEPISTDSFNIDPAASSSIPYMEGIQGDKIRRRRTNENSLVIAADKVIVGVQSEAQSIENVKDVMGQKVNVQGASGRNQKAINKQFGNLNTLKGKFETE